MAKKRTYYKHKESIFTPYKQNIQDYPFALKKRNASESDWNREGNELPIIGDISNKSGWSTGMGERLAFANKIYPSDPTEQEYFARRDMNIDGGNLTMDVAVVGGLLLLGIAAIIYAKNKPITL